jgi:hypothetical protein
MTQKEMYRAEVKIKKAWEKAWRKEALRELSELGPVVPAVLYVSCRS